MTDLDQARTQALEDIAAAGDLDEIERLRVSLLGKKGSIALLMRALGDMSPDERRLAGQTLNQLKDVVSAALDARKEALDAIALDRRLASERVDVTLPAR